MSTKKNVRQNNAVSVNSPLLFSALIQNILSKEKCMFGFYHTVKCTT